MRDETDLGRTATYGSAVSSRALILRVGLLMCGSLGIGLKFRAGAEADFLKLSPWQTVPSPYPSLLWRLVFDKPDHIPT